MALFLKQQEDQRSQLQEKIAAQLKERTQVAKDIRVEKPDAAFLDNQHTTKPIGIILAIIGVVVIGFIAWLVQS